MALFPDGYMAVGRAEASGMVGPEHGVEGDKGLARHDDEKVGAHGLGEGEQAGMGRCVPWRSPGRNMAV